MLRFGLWYDFRISGGSPSGEELHSSTLDQIAWAEQLGYDSVWLGEHHFTDDGYGTSPLVLAAAIAARTSRVGIGTAVVAASLYDPLRLAEDAATVSLLSGGRFDLGLGLGYRAIEFEAFGRELRYRPSLMEESLEVIRRAWSGEPLSFEGKRFSYPDVRVTPTPDHPPRLLLGGGSEPAFERAARLGDGFLSLTDEHIPLYLDAVERGGGDRAAAKVIAGKSAVIAPDPERTWARVGDCVLKQVNDYIAWGGFGPPDQIPLFADRDALLESGAIPAWDADAATQGLTQLLREYPQIEDLYLVAQYPGETVESGSERIEYFIREVAPRIRAELGSPAAAPAHPNEER